jgi:hypothetical protein
MGCMKPACWKTKYRGNLMAHQRELMFLYRVSWQTMFADC